MERNGEHLKENNNGDRNIWNSNNHDDRNTWKQIQQEQMKKEHIAK